MESKKQIIKKLRELKPKLNRDFAVKEIGLFGSFMEDSQNDDSDIDLLIDLVTKNALKSQLKTRILKQVTYI